MSKGIAARREREREALRQRILEAARQLFRQEDYGSVSLRKIAERIEYSPTTIYLYFKDKHALVMELVAEGFALLLHKMKLAEQADSVQTLRQSGLEYLRFSLEEPHYYRLMFQLHDQELNDLCRQHEQRVSDGCFQYLMDTIARVRLTGKLAMPLSDLMVAHILWAGLHGAASLALGGLLDRLPEQERQSFFETTVATLSRAALGGVA
ncbi:TetR/AcrR family transcriptional regulator [bacterium]|nr:TetR/AcrR family transcriptional regulator [bacterium]